MMPKAKGKSTSDEKTPRSRRTFSDVEKQLIMQLVSKEKHVIDLKQNTGKVLTEKKAAWDRIVQTFNAQPGLKPCEAMQLKKVVENLKSKAKKDVAKETKMLNKTGGGPMEEDSVADDVNHMVTSFCSEVLHPLDNDVDDDTGYHKKRGRYP